MATVESITKRLDEIDEDRVYFGIDDFVLARPTTGESKVDAMFREHPSKTISPALLESFLSVD